MSTNKNLQGTNGDPWWRAWWRRFRKDFSSAEPEKQVAQIYYITAVLAVFGSLLAGLWAFGEHFWPDKLATSLQKTSETTVTADAALPPTLSIVALPFANLSGDPTQDYFADGITDSLTTDLSRALPGSFVVARETAFTYKGQAVDFKRLRHELDVRYVLEGSVLLDGEQVRVNARLVDARTTSGIWAERFDTVRSDILRAQDEIVGRLSRAIGLEVT